MPLPFTLPRFAYLFAPLEAVELSVTAYDSIQPELSAQQEDVSALQPEVLCDFTVTPLFHNNGQSDSKG